MKAAFFDVDGTLTDQRVWSGLLDYFVVHRKKLGLHYLFKVYHYVLYGLHKLGLIPQVKFRSIWAKNLAWYFKGFDQEEARHLWEWTVNERIQGHWREDVLRKLLAHKQAGDLTFLVSGGPEGLLAQIAQAVGADHVVGTRHEIVEGVYTGRPGGEPCQGENKALLVRQKAAELGLHLDFRECYAYADAIGDLSLLELVGHPVAVYPEAKLLEIAQQRGWETFEG